MDCTGKSRGYRIMGDAAASSVSSLLLLDASTLSNSGADTESVDADVSVEKDRLYPLVVGRSFQTMKDDDDGGEKRK